MKLKSKLKSKMKKGGNIDTEGLFITEQIKETVKKGLDKDLEKKYQLQVLNVFNKTLKTDTNKKNKSNDKFL